MTASKTSAPRKTRFRSSKLRVRRFARPKFQFKKNQIRGLGATGGTPAGCAARTGSVFFGSIYISISAPNPILPSLYASAFACTSRARQCVSSAFPPVTSVGITNVASMGMPTCNGAEVTKKNPPREILVVSAKCSAGPDANPSGRKRNGTRIRKRSRCLRSELGTWFSEPGEKP
jgi:hypothetical protein